MWVAQHADSVSTNASIQLSLPPLPRLIIIITSLHHCSVAGEVCPQGQQGRSTRTAEGR